MTSRLSASGKSGRVSGSTTRLFYCNHFTRARVFSFIPRLCRSAISRSLLTISRKCRLGAIRIRRPETAPIRSAPVDPFQQHRQLSRRARCRTLLDLRPGEEPGALALVIEHQAIAAVPKDFYFVAATSAEDVKVAREWLSLSWCCTWVHRPSKPRRRSVAPATVQILDALGAPMMPTPAARRARARQARPLRNR